MKKAFFILIYIFVTWQIFARDDYGSQFINGKSFPIAYPFVSDDIDMGDYFDLMRSDKYDEFLKLFDVMSRSPGFNENYYYGDKIQIEILNDIVLSAALDCFREFVGHKIVVRAQYKSDEKKDYRIEIKSPDELEFCSTRKSAKAGKNVKIIYKVHLKNPIERLAEWYHYQFYGKVGNFGDIKETKDGYEITVNIDDTEIYISPGI